MNRAIIVHGWDDRPTGSWFPWVKQRLQRRGYAVKVPAMPHPHRPTIRDWVATLRRVVGRPDGQTVLIGHSVGCQTIIRYLAKLGRGENVGTVVLVAGWVSLKPAATPDAFYRRTARPWLTRPIQWSRVRRQARRFVYIASTNDPYVPLTDAKIFRRRLGAKVIRLRRGHFLDDEDGVTKFPVVIRTLHLR